MREDILRILKNIWRRKVKSQGQSIDFDQILTLSKIREEKSEKLLQKLYFQKLERKRRILIFREELDLL